MTGFIFTTFNGLSLQQAPGKKLPKTANFENNGRNTQKPEPDAPLPCHVMVLNKKQRCITY